MIKVIQVVEEISDIVFVEVVVGQCSAQELRVRYLTCLVNVNFVNKAVYVLLRDDGIDILI